MNSALESFSLACFEATIAVVREGERDHGESQRHI